MPRRYRIFFSDYLRTVRGFSANAKNYLWANFLIGASFAFQSVIFNLYLAEAGLKEGMIGSILSLGGLGLVISALPAGWLSDRWGRKRAMVFGLASGSLVMWLRALTTDQRALLTLGLLGGVSSTIYQISAAPFMMENSRQDERTHLFSMSFAVTLIAGVIGNLIAGKLPWLFAALWPSLSNFWCYRLTLLCGSIISWAGLIPLKGIQDQVPSAAANDQRGQAISRSATRMLIQFAWCNWWIGLGAGLVIPFFNLYFSRRFGSSSGQIGFYFSVSQILTLLAVLAGPAVARRWGKVRTVALMELLSLPFLVSLGAEKRLSSAVVSFWMRASLMQMASPIANSFTMETVPESLRAVANSWTMISWNLSWTISAAASGWMMQRYGYAVPYYLTAACYAISSVSYYLMFRKHELLKSVGRPVQKTSPGGP